MGGTLPVELTDFEAIRETCDVVALAWETASETDNAGFEVLRTEEIGGVAVEKMVGFVSGGGTTASMRAYEFIDALVPSGQVLYRLRQVDHDGTDAWSDYVSAGEGCDLGGAQTYRVIDVLGAGRGEVSGNAAAGLRTRLRDELALPAGVYYLMAIRGGSEVIEVVVW